MGLLDFVNDNESLVRDAKNGIKEVYYMNNLPWVIGYSGGKDSTCTTQIIVDSLIELRNEGKELNKKVYIISLLKTKDYKTIIKNICKEKDSIFIFTSGNDKKRYVSKEKLYKEAKKYLNDINMYKYELKDAINICKKAYSDRVILIVGSFYVYKTVCEVLKND